MNWLDVTAADFSDCCKCSVF